jgi:hypothetical protein
MKESFFGDVRNDELSIPLEKVHVRNTKHDKKQNSEANTSASFVLAPKHVLLIKLLLDLSIWLQRV